MIWGFGAGVLFMIFLATVAEWTDQQEMKKLRKRNQKMKGGLKI